MKRRPKKELLAEFRSDLGALVSLFGKLLEQHEARGLRKREMLHAYIDELCDSMGVPR